METKNYPKYLHTKTHIFRETSTSDRYNLSLILYFVSIQEFLKQSSMCIVS